MRLVFSEIHEDAPLRHRLEYEVEFVVFEVSKPPVHEFGAAAAGVKRQIAHLDDGHREATKGCVTGDPCPIDSAANDEDIDLVP